MNTYSTNINILQTTDMINGQSPLDDTPDLFNYPYRDYQLDVIQKAGLNTKGQFIYPTGSGKTVMQAGIIAKDMMRTDGFAVYVNLSPRIDLVDQHVGNIIDRFIDEKLDCHYCVVHSGNRNAVRAKRAKLSNANMKVSSGAKPTTSSLEIQKEIEYAREHNLPVCIFTTYHSMEKVAAALRRLELKGNIVIADEAHHLTQLKNNKKIRNFPYSKFFSFTATARNSDNPNKADSLFMDNHSLFGYVLGRMPPKVSCLRGFTVPPELIFFETENLKDHDELSDNFSAVVEVMLQKAQEQLNKDYAARGLKPPGVKMLIAAEGTGDIRRFQANERLHHLHSLGYKTFTIESKESHSDESNGTGCRVDGEKVSRGKFFEAVKDTFDDYESQCVVIHYDMLTEGIDLSGFNFFVPWRSSLGLSSFTQNAGRCCRPLPEDVEKINSGLIRKDSNGYILEEDRKKLTKSKYYIMIPEITEKQKNNSYNNRVLYEYLIDSEFDMTEVISRNTEKGSSPRRPEEDEELSFGSEWDERLEAYTETLLSRLTKEMKKANYENDYVRAEELDYEIYKITSMRS